jgi:spore germination protein YaaH
MKYTKFRILIILTVLFICTSLSPASAQNGLFNMSYLFFGSPTSYLDQVKATKGSLKVVSPNYFDISKEGKLTLTWTLQMPFIDKMHEQGIKVVPFLSNHWSLSAGKNGLANREQLAKDIADAIETFHLDGVNVDIEGVGSDYKDAHTDFIRLLRQYIPTNKEVSVAVAANPNGWKTGWHGFYDYKRLSDYADYLMIMAYDESWESPDSPIGPVASISFSERSIQYAINQGVPKNKIVYGLPFYGRIWKLDGPTLEGKTLTGHGLSSTRVEPLVKKFNGEFLFDEKSQSAYATFTIPKGDSSLLGSTKLTEGKYVIWYENERSIKAKLSLPKKYGIKGTGSWALYHETPQTWDYYASWLNGQYFTDVALGYWAEENIQYVSNKGWMQGISSTNFAPKAPLTRAQGAVILVRALGKDKLKPSTHVFNDVSGHWAKNEIEIARELGYINGKSKEKFDPNAPLTREQLAEILNNIFQYELSPDVTNAFIDIDENDWSFNSVMAIYQQGYLKGLGEGTFGPKNTSSRAEMAALMERMAPEIEKKRTQ